MSVPYADSTHTIGSSEAHFSDAVEHAKWEEPEPSMPPKSEAEVSAMPQEQSNPQIQTIASTGAAPLSNIHALETSPAQLDEADPMSEVPIVSTTAPSSQPASKAPSVKLVEPVVPPAPPQKTYFWHHKGHHPPQHHSNLRVSMHDIESGPWGYERRRGGMTLPELSGIEIIPDQEEEGGSMHTVVEDAKAEEERYEKETQHLIVKWDGKDDREHVLNLPFWFRVYLMSLLGILTLCTAFTSSAPSSLLAEIVIDLKTTPSVVKASVFLFVASFCVGPLVWAPLAELFGGRITFIISFTGFVCFNVGCMLAPNIASLIVFRILAGAFGSSSLSNSPAMIAGLFHMKYLMVTLTLFALMPVAGPCLGPIVGGFISQAHADWRWIFRVCTIFSFVLLVLVVFTLPETMTPQRLQMKAKRLRKETGDDRYVAPVELRKIEWWKLPGQVVGKPIKMIIVEPMLLVTTIYISFVYGTLYLLFVAYPYVFRRHGLGPGPIGLTFLGFFVGCVMAGLYCIVVDQPQYVRGMEKNGGKPLAPEVRLRPCMLGAVLLTVSLFWFAWTSYDWISFWSPLVAGGLFGAGLFFIFMSLFTYVTEVYIFSSASAIAINTVFRSAFGAGFPMFGEQMYDRLNPQWATTVLAFIALVMVPIPFVLIKYGHKIRAMSRNARS